MFDLLLGATVNIVAMVTAAKEAKTYHVIEVLRRRVTRSAAAAAAKKANLRAWLLARTGTQTSLNSVTGFLFSLRTKLCSSVLCVCALGRRKNGLFVELPGVLKLL